MRFVSIKFIWLLFLYRAFKFFLRCTPFFSSFRPTHSVTQPHGTSFVPRLSLFLFFFFAFSPRFACSLVYLCFNLLTNAKWWAQLFLIRHVFSLRCAVFTWISRNRDRFTCRLLLSLSMSVSFQQKSRTKSILVFGQLEIFSTFV